MIHTEVFGAFVSLWNPQCGYRFSLGLFRDGGREEDFALINLHGSQHSSKLFSKTVAKRLNKKDVNCTIRSQRSSFAKVFGDRM